MRRLQAQRGQVHHRMIAPAVLSGLNLSLSPALNHLLNLALNLNLNLNPLHWAR
jgi:hypothetical protein